ncbi:MAG TPA: HAD domain-containing protein [Polyangiaceae bacterium]|jgi:hypothetical protein|nr:HAD domain-containing protein [Polyangiaceae bacterium]
MNLVIFLDIDGVLNSAAFILQQTNGEGVTVVDDSFDATAHIDPSRVERLNRLIADTGASVVLSSSWRLLFGREKTQSSLRQRGFAHELADETPRIFGSDRHVEIKAYLSTLTPPVSFVVLDDDEMAGVDLVPHFIHVRDGLEDEHVERARRVILGAR